jgi:hypothetical protein
MKAFKYLLSVVLIIAAVSSCTDEKFGDLAFTDSITAPENLSALFTVTPDNTGAVTITPNGVGAVSYDVYFGNEITTPVNIKQGESTQSVYAEGNYNVKVVGYAVNGLKTEITVPLLVSFIAPTNLQVIALNDEGISKQVNVTVTADFATSFEVYFGEEGNDDPVLANIGEAASYLYTEPGTYTIRVVAMGAAAETTEQTFEFEVTEIVQPVTPAPVPTAQPANVVSIYSDAYTDVNISELNPNWGQSTMLTEIQVDGDNIWFYSALNYTGIVTDYGNPTDLSGMSHVHFDYWTPDGTTLGLKLVNTAYGDGDPLKEDLEDVGTMTQGTWVSVDIPLEDFSTDVSGITQLLFDALGNTANVYIDNLYFYQDVPTSPAIAAPTPTAQAGNVVSIYSDAYTSVNLSELNPNWGQTTDLTEIEIDGNKIWKYENLNYTGIVTDYGNPTDLSGTTHVHFDYWTPNATVLGLKLVNTAYGDGDPLKEDIETVGDITLGGWVSVDIPLSDFSTDVSGITQLLFDTFGETADVFIDNLYFYKEIPTSPAVAAPVPTLDAANVISIYSDAYTGVALSEVNPNWGQTTTLSEVQIEGNNTWLYENLNFTGIVTDYGNATDLSAMTHVHFDYWTPDGVSLGLKLVNTAYGDGDPLKEDIENVGTMVHGSWVSVEIPLADYSTDMSGITQLLFDTFGENAKVYIDNLYFHN